MRKLVFLMLAGMVFMVSKAQPPTMTDSARNFKKDSTLRALIHADSAKVNKQYAEIEKWSKMEAREIYPVIKGGKGSGVIPVTDPTEVPDPNIDYKLLFEVTSVNPDSSVNEINSGLDEVARVINLHYASGVPLKRIIPVVVVHAGAVFAIMNNVAYQKKYKMDNPNIKIIDDLKKLGARFIVCGQAMAFTETNKEDLLPDMRISLTAQTALSHYQLKGYVIYR